MFPAMPTVPVNLASQELSSTTSTTTTTTVTTNTTTTITSGFNLYFKPPSAWANDTGLINVASLPSTMTVNSVVTPVMTYGRLESMVDKWHLHLRNQEKHFLYQANQVSSWNHTLIENRDEITLLRHEVEKVKLDQSRLERELDFILAQQKELEHLLTPLEEFVKKQNGPFNLLYVDKEYEKIYKLAETIDAELKRMSQDLKDIIGHLNSLGSPGDAAEPFQVQEICKLLNAHMDSLQWISQNSGIMQKKVKEVAKAFEDYHCKEQECNMKFAFE
ncbi:nucleoporin-62 C-terminal-like protein [Peromyscus californicus insignis]|uniref:nucleoporin-62 C-terminal-like protein n=1 Tax=Peromyscus californicus insignis TaxID=564181 RepID=UPI0022A77787|nr:nucleoporin-62 C-terminal-like protein [Peromyscus californicus insignis]XP_052602422.1 nucleoporin-62 C-terminal-like protein [Peromyscus californicus insignis]